MVTAESDEACAAANQVVGADLDLVDGLADVERVELEITRINDLVLGEGVDVQSGVVRSQQPRGLSNVARTEAGAGSVGNTGVEWRTDDGDAVVGYVFNAWKLSIM